MRKNISEFLLSTVNYILFTYLYLCYLLLNVNNIIKIIYFKDIK